MLDRLRNLNGNKKETERQKLLDIVSPVFSGIKDDELITTVSMIFNFHTLVDEYRYYWPKAKKYSRLALLYRDLNQKQLQFVSSALKFAFDKFGDDTAGHFRTCDMDHFISKVDNDIEEDYIDFLIKALQL